MLDCIIKGKSIVGSSWALWRTATGDAVLERSIENRCIKIQKAPRCKMRTWALNKWYHFVPHSLLSVAGILQFPFVRYFTWIPWIFRSVSVSVAQCSRESNGVGLRIVMCITSHNYDVTNMCLDTIVCAWQPPAGLPTTPFEIKYVRQT